MPCFIAARGRIAVLQTLLSEPFPAIGLRPGRCVGPFVHKTDLQAYTEVLSVSLWPSSDAVTPIARPLHHTPDPLQEFISSDCPGQGSR
ncbi:hypothetical protein OF83DRAFT_678754 [Amylostereum chailletii]|nr:hypothetical protein OF83DRAFT_678754 [Amylostereum chailletii]